MKISCSDGEKPIHKIDTIYPAKSTKKGLINPQYNKAGQLNSHIVDGINRPCLTPSKGNHTFKYYYYKNGLINKIDIIKPTKEKYMTWFFIYETEGEYRRQ